MILIIYIASRDTYLYLQIRLKQELRLLEILAKDETNISVFSHPTDTTKRIVSGAIRAIWATIFYNESPVYKVNLS